MFHYSDSFLFRHSGDEFRNDRVIFKIYFIFFYIVFDIYVQLHYIIKYFFFFQKTQALFAYVRGLVWHKPTSGGERPSHGRVHGGNSLQISGSGQRLHQRHRPGEAAGQDELFTVRPSRQSSLCGPRLHIILRVLAHRLG